MVDRKKISRLKEWIIERGIAGTAFLSFACILLILVFVFREALPLFAGRPAQVASTEAPAVMETYGEDPAAAAVEGPDASLFAEASEEAVTPSRLLAPAWQPVSMLPQFGLWPLVVGSLKVTLIALLLATPLAVLAALYTSMFAPRWAREVIKPVIEILAGFPSVIIGFFALMVLASMLQALFGLEYRLNSFTGGVALSLAVIPIIYTLSEDALNAVPRHYVEASQALGAEKWESMFYVVLPAATPGIFAAILLGVGRAFGETMIVLMATGNAAILSLDPLLPTRTLSATIGAEMAEVVFGDNHYVVLFFIGVVLFLFSFFINLIVEVFIRQRLMRRFSGA